jgi:hypothetical protein
MLPRQAHLPLDPLLQPLLPVSNLILLGYENILHIISILKNILGFVLWSRI